LAETGRPLDLEGTGCLTRPWTGESQQRRVVIAVAFFKLQSVTSRDRVAAAKAIMGMQGSAHRNRNSGIELPKTSSSFDAEQ
jgi:hypothetical protein